MRSAMTSGTTVSSSENRLALAGREPRASTVIDAPSGGRSWDGGGPGGVCACAVAVIATIAAVIIAAR
jgi:hypothetical protein